MARTKQTGPEIKLYQIDTMLYLSTKNIITKLAMFTQFIKEGGIAVADSLKVNRARALERYDSNYKISDIEKSNNNGQANETWLRKNGLLDSGDGRYELSPIAMAINENKISYADYCFLLLSKQWIKVKELGRKDEYKENMLSFILQDLLSCKRILVSDFVSHFGGIAIDAYKEEYEGLSLSNQEAARYLIEPLQISGLIEEVDNYYLIPNKFIPLAKDYIINSKLIRRIDTVNCTDEEYWNSFQFGFYDLINESNESIYMQHYPHLFVMKNTYKKNGNLSLQQIFYGAPGTGKSHKVKYNEKVKSSDEKNLVFRTTFHPDSDYSTFVGAYKPTMKLVADKYKAVAGKDEEITYEFIPQAFLQAYIAAWNNQKENVFLVIEEINRGNCAQIFGDLFQLLDRDDDGFSEYPIKADRDLAKYLNGKDEKGNDVLVNKDGIKDGKLKLPNNLYIWATMNTSDQSLFPIDSAFKRRWDWVYIPIGYKNNNWTIVIGDKKYNWVDFQHKINESIYAIDNSEDKQLGDYFVNADRTNFEISADTFLNKILFYIWNDVCKDDPDQIFRWIDDNQEKNIKFSDFFGADRDKKLQGFMSFHKVSAIEETTNADNSEDTQDEVTDTDEIPAEDENDVNS